MLRALLLYTIATLLCGALGPPLACADVIQIVHFWPGDPPCDGTLQGCIDGANAGEPVVITTNDPIDEDIAITKSLILEAGTGAAPVFAAGRSIQAMVAGASAQTIRISDLTLSPTGAIRVVDGATGPLALEISRNVAGSIEISDNKLSGVNGTLLSFDVTDNSVVLRADAFSTGIGLDPTDGSGWGGRIAGNAIHIEGVDRIGIAAGNVAQLDVVGNRVEGTYEGRGIQLTTNDGAVGGMSARLLDNVLSGAHGGFEDAGHAGILAEADYLTISPTIMNNTIVDCDFGVLFFGGSGGFVGGYVANNVIVGSGYAGLELVLQSSASNNHNLFFDNATNLSGTGTLGPGTVLADPLFVVPGADYHLLPGSPAIDRGDDGIPADLTEDFEGNPRIQGPHVDIGAYEGAPEPAAVLGGAAALAALSARARRAQARRRARRRSQAHWKLWIPTLLIIPLNSAIAAADDGSVVYWGGNGFGEGTPPASVNGTSGTASAIAAGYFHSCAIQTGSGAVVCWGNDDYGQSSPPDAVNGAAGAARAVASGYNHSCAIQVQNGGVWCWGSNEKGQTSVPAAVDGPDGRALAISVGGDHSCAIRLNKFDPFHVVCWGENDHGESTPADSVRAVSLAAGAFHTCAIDPAGAVVCWGDDVNGDSTPPDSVNGTSGTASAIAAGAFHSCAIQTGSGGVVCWGSNYYGQTAVPAAVDGTHGSAISIAAGAFHSCAIQTGSGGVVCWGDNESGESTPPASLRASSVAAGGDHSLAIAVPEASALSSAAGAAMALALLRRAGLQRIRRSWTA